MEPSMQKLLDQNIAAVRAARFFIRKVEEGLAVSSQSLSEKEKKWLELNVLELDESDLQPERAQQLQAKCIGALSEAYARDTVDNNKEAALEWRKQNKELYHGHSPKVIAGIVQNWYLSTGRAQEKHAVGCAPILLGFLGICAAILMLAWLL